VAAKRQELRELMWQGAGIVRRVPEMKAALSQISELCVEAKAMAESYGVSTGQLIFLLDGS
jgi:aspartate oxidase